MKTKLLCTILSAVFLLFVSCASESKIPKSVPSVHNDTSLKAVEAIGVQLERNAASAVWYRMSEEYRIVISEDRFVENWNKETENLGTVSEVKDPVLLEDGTYQIICLPMTFSKGNLYATFTVFAEALNPLDVKYSDSFPVLDSSGNGKIKLSKEETTKWTEEAGKFPNYNLVPALTEPALKDLCKDYFRIGCGITGASTSNTAVKSPEFMKVAEKHFSSWTSTNLMKPSYLMNQKRSMKNAEEGNETPVLDFTAAIPVLDYAKEHGIQMRGHTLVWHTQVPDWFFLEGYKNNAPVVDRETMKFRMESYISQYITFVQENYPGVVYCWDVVNEAVDPGNGDKSVNWSCRKKNDTYPNMWYEALGTDYVELAFKYARKYADPDVALFYNDYGTFDRTKRQYIYNLVTQLKEKNLIDGIGMQGYWDFKNPDLQTLKDTIDLYASTGLEIQLTEWSVAAPDESDANMILQAERHASILRLLQKMDTQGGGNANITCVSFFGLMNHFMFSPGDKTNSRPFDENLEPNRLFYGIKDTFEKFYR